MTTPKTIAPAALTAVAASYYTTDDVQGMKAIIKKLVFCNTTVASVSVTLYQVPKGGAPTNANIIWSAKALQAGETKECYEAEGMVLERADSLQALGLGVNVTGSVAVVSQ